MELVGEDPHKDLANKQMGKLATVIYFFFYGFKLSALAALMLGKTHANGKIFKVGKKLNLHIANVIR